MQLLRPTSLSKGFEGKELTDLAIKAHVVIKNEKYKKYSRDTIVTAFTTVYPQEICIILEGDNVDIGPQYTFYEFLSLKEFEEMFISGLTNYLALPANKEHDVIYLISEGRYGLYNHQQVIQEYIRENFT